MKKKDIKGFVKINLIIIILLLFSVLWLNDNYIKDLGKVPRMSTSEFVDISKVHAGIISDIKPKKYIPAISVNEVEVVSQPKQEPLPDVTECPQRKYNFNDEDILVLSKIIQAEAGNQSLKGKCLVGRVILNRVESGSNNTIKSVVFANRNGIYQFSPINDKRYFSAIPTQSVYEAIDMLSYGWDESLGAQYFCRGYSKWHENHLTRLFKEGDHIFYK